MLQQLFELTTSALYVLSHTIPAYRGIFKGGGYGGEVPFWTSEIYGFQELFKPTGAESPPWKEKKIKPPNGQIPKYAYTGLTDKQLEKVVQYTYTLIDDKTG